jgi:TorA maturation chaperone TorD
VTNRPAGGLLADVAGFYRAFCFPFARSEIPAIAGPPDRLATELSFVSFLFAKEAYACCGGDTEAADACRHGRDLFLREHLGQWIGRLAGRLDQCAPETGYERAARLAQQVVAGTGAIEAFSDAPQVAQADDAANLDDAMCGGCPVAASPGEAEAIVV